VTSQNPAQNPEQQPELHPDLQRALATYIGHARWFGGKGRQFTVTGVRSLELSDGTPRVAIALVTLRFEDDVEEQLYQLPVASYPEPQSRLEHVFIAEVEGRHVYDAMHDRDAAASWLSAFNEAGFESDGVLTRPDGLTFHRTGTHELDLTTHSTVFRGEQSNTSVAFGDDALMKTFRRVTPGVNPDIEIHDALTRAGTHTVAELYGWLEVADPDPDTPPIQLAMLQQFLRTASDGWELALASTRNLFAEADLHADEVGGDFAGEAHRLGVAVSEVHELLRQEFPTQPFDAAGTAETMRQRLASATAIVPELAEHTDALHRIFDRLGDTGGEIQRIHGDLHLGQTLRTSLGWKLVDFEGEPAKTLAERQLPDSPWRDVAGMLRSFDYAAQSLVKDLHASQEASPQITYRAQEWVERNRTAFLEGYVERRSAGAEPGPSVDDTSAEGLSAAEQAMIDAYEADKAVYETVYEARNRPTWLDIPLHAIDRIGADL
jgi:maltokinase